MRTRSVALCIFVHAVNNVVALYYMSRLNEGGDMTWEGAWWLNLAGAVLLAAGGAWLWRATRGGPPADKLAAALPPPLPAM